MSQISQSSVDFRSLVQSLRATPDTLKHIAEGFRSEELTGCCPVGAWSFLEHICHLRDIEIEGYSVRIGRILDEEYPVLSDIDGARLAAERDYMSEDFESVLTAFALERRQNLEVVSTLSPKQLNRTAIFGDSGAITLLTLLEMMAEHDQDHLRQLEELCAFRSSKANAMP